MVQLEEKPQFDTSMDFELDEPVWNCERVLDWDARIASYTDAQKAFYARMIPTIDELQALKDRAAGWRVLVNDKRKHIKIEASKSPRGFHMMRASGPIDYPPIDVWRCANYGKDRRGWDDSADTTYYMTKEGVNSYTTYSKSKAVLFVQGRDFVLD